MTAIHRSVKYVGNGIVIIVALRVVLDRSVRRHILSILAAHSVLALQ